MCAALLILSSLCWIGDQRQSKCKSACFLISQSSTSHLFQQWVHSCRCLVLSAVLPSNSRRGLWGQGVLLTQQLLSQYGFKAIIMGGWTLAPMFVEAYCMYMYAHTIYMYTCTCVYAGIFTVVLFFAFFRESFSIHEKNTAKVITPMDSHMGTRLA